MILFGLNNEFYSNFFGSVSILFILTGPSSSSQSSNVLLLFRDIDGEKTSLLLPLPLPEIEETGDMVKVGTLLA